MQALFGSFYTNHWAVFTYDSGMGVVDHNGEVHQYEWKDVKKVKTNFTDASIVRVIIRKGRHLDLRFGKNFTAINPQRLLSEEKAESAGQPQRTADAVNDGDANEGSQESGGRGSQW
jgi:hypothetical protein